MVCGVLPHVDLWVETLIELGQRLREGQTIAVKQIRCCSCCSDSTSSSIEWVSRTLTFRRTLLTGRRRRSADPVEHPDTVLLALNGFANNVGHAAGTDRQLLFTVGQLFGQAAELNLHLLDRFHRIIGANNILTDTLAQMLVYGNEELNFALRTFRIFRDTQHVAQMFVIGDRQTQRPSALSDIERSSSAER